MGFWVFLVHPTVVLVLLSASVERCFVSRMRDFLPVPGCVALHQNGLLKHVAGEAAADRSQRSHSDFHVRDVSGSPLEVLEGG